MTTDLLRKALRKALWQLCEGSFAPGFQQRRIRSAHLSWGPAFRSDIIEVVKGDHSEHKVDTETH